MPEHEVVFHLVSSKVKVAVLHAYKLININLVFYLEGKHLRSVYNLGFVYKNLYFTGRYIWINGFFGSRPYLALYGNYPFVSYVPGFFVRFFAYIRIEHYL